jgi:hypothetical protein
MFPGIHSWPFVFRPHDGNRCRAICFRQMNIYITACSRIRHPLSSVLASVSRRRLVEVIAPTALILEITHKYIFDELNTLFDHVLRISAFLYVFERDIHIGQRQT